MFRFNEKPTSRQSTMEPPSYTLLYTAAGSSDDTHVRNYAQAATPAIVSHVYGTLYRQDIQVEWEGPFIANVTVPYAPKKRESGNWTFDYDTTGGTVNIKLAKAHVATYPTGGSPPDHQGAIGVNGDNVDGVDIVIPALKLTVSFSHPTGVATIARAKMLARNTGKTNSDTFLTFEPGEVLFLGATGSDGSDAPATEKLQFACSENLSSHVIGGITVASKKGWDVAWVQFKDDVASGKPIRPPEFIHVERVYEQVAMATLFGFGG
jgi:hypothetical protein